MKRRDLLVTVGSVAAGAGCLAPGGGDPTDTAAPTDGSTTPVTETPVTPVGPPEASDEFADVACAGFTDADRTVCYHTAGVEESVVLAAEPELFAPDREDNTVEALYFTLYNRGEWTVLVNPYDWAIHRREDDESWSRVAPEGAVQEPLAILEPGQSLRWELPEMTHPSPGGDGTYRVDTALAPGVYAFSVTGHYSGTNLTETPTATPPQGRTEFVALFRLDSAIGGAAETETPATETQ